MTITQDIIGWAKTRPLWQQRVLQKLAAAQPVSPDLLEEIVEGLTGDDPNAASGPATFDLALPTAQSEQVVALGLRDCKGVNALADSQALSFAESGLTVIYGDNGSGKSGYARLLKDATGARHTPVVLPDVFQDAPDEPCATLIYAVDGDVRGHKYPSPVDVNVRRMSFYDEHCGDLYLTKKSTLSYRPSALVLLDGLIEVCDALRDLLLQRRALETKKALNLSLPGTPAEAFIVRLSGATTEEEIAAATTLPGDFAEQYAEVAAEVARLDASSVTRERERLAALAASYRAVAEHLQLQQTTLGPDALDEAGRDLKSAVDLRAAATVTAAQNFDDELTGVGGGAWRALWQAARQYSTSDAYPGAEFPVVQQGSRCVLCQQTLDASARDRLHRFDHYMANTTQRDAAEAEARVAQHLTALTNAMPQSAQLASHVTAIENDNRAVGVDLLAALRHLEDTRDRAISWLQGTGPRPVVIRHDDATLVARAEELDAAADKVDLGSFTLALSQARTRLWLLEAARTLSNSVALVSAEVERLRRLARLDKAIDSVGTTTITSKSSQLTRLYAGDVIKDRFVRETERLHLRRVTMQDLGGRKGQLEQQPGLLGAKARGVETQLVLSEGEQTALGLAGFFTEAEFDSGRSALILDDPVTSLDHVRREHVARRLAELASDRQVIVFTHDVAFAGELTKQAGRSGSAVSVRSVERIGHVPGYVRDTLPWKAKDFAARRAELEARLSALVKERASLSQEDWEEKVASGPGNCRSCGSDPSAQRFSTRCTTVAPPRCES